MKTFIKIFYVLLILLLLKFLLAYGANEIFIKNYENGKYQEKLVKSLGFCNISESYVAYYNYGNYYYQKGKYADAVREYNKALESNPPKEKECSIIINKTLCILTQVDLENKTNEENLEILYQAREILCEKGCAHSDDDQGHSPEAEQLKKEIDELIEKLKDKDKEPTDPSEQNEPKEKDPDEEQKQDPEKAKKKEEKLKKRQKESAKDRQEGQSANERLDNGTYINFGEKNW